MIEKRFIYLLIGLSVASLGFYWWHASNKDKTPTVQKIYRVPPIPDPKTENGTGMHAEIEQDEKAAVAVPFCPE